MIEKVLTSTISCTFCT